MKNANEEDEEKRRKWFGFRERKREKKFGRWRNRQRECLIYRQGKEGICIALFITNKKVYLYFVEIMNVLRSTNE